MKIGVRKPSIKKSIKARTTGKIKRSVKKAVNPMYGKKGMGMINNPKKAVYNKVYNKTTVGATDLLSGGSSRSSKSQSAAPSSSKQPAFSESTSTYFPKPSKTFGIVLKVLSIIIILLSLLLLLALPVAGVLFMAFGIFMFVVGRSCTKRAKQEAGIVSSDEETVEDIGVEEDDD